MTVTDHLTSNKLLNPHQSAYCKHHSTETALLYIHDHLINAIGSQKLSCLCLLDLSAAFDTIDHSILLIRLSSWLGIHGSVLNWFKSYLSSRSFRVRCNNIFSSFCTSSCGVPRGSVLGPLLFIMYTTPYASQHSHLLPFTQSPPSCRWHPTVFLILPTQLRFMHYPPSECPSANLFLDDCQPPNSQLLQDRLYAYSSDSESNLTRYTTPQLTPLTLLATLDSSLMNILHLKTPKCCHITPILHSLHWLKITECIKYKLLSLTYKVLTTTQPPYFHNRISVPKLITVILCYNLPKSQITRLQQIQNSLVRVDVKTPKCCHITPILHSLHWLKVTERIEYKLLSLTYKVLTTTQPPYLHNLISAQPPRNTLITLPSLDHQHNPRYA